MGNKKQIHEITSYLNFVHDWDDPHGRIYVHYWGDDDDEFILETTALRIAQDRILNTFIIEYLSPCVQFYLVSGLPCLI